LKGSDTDDAVVQILLVPPFLARIINSTR